MEKLLKPGQLAIDPNSPTAGKGWKHWVRRFEDYVSQFTASKSEDKAEAYKLSVIWSIMQIPKFMSTLTTAKPTVRLKLFYKSCTLKNRLKFSPDTFC